MGELQVEVEVSLVDGCEATIRVVNVCIEESLHTILSLLLEYLSTPTSARCSFIKSASIPYSEGVGYLIYAMLCTRPTIAHAVLGSIF